MDCYTVEITEFKYSLKFSGALYTQSCIITTNMECETSPGNISTVQQILVNLSFAQCIYATYPPRGGGGGGRGRLRALLPPLPP